jgi:hypothetical protein
MPPAYVTLKQLTSRPDLNGVLTKVVAWSDEDERVGVKLPAVYGGECIRVKRNSLVAGPDPREQEYWDEPAHDRTDFSCMYSPSSTRAKHDERFQNEEDPNDPDDDIDLMSGGLASLFIDNAFRSLTTAVYELVAVRNLEIVANGHLVGNGAEDYLDLQYDPSKCRYDEFDLVKVDAFILGCVGHLERLLLAGLQLIHKSKRRDRGDCVDDPYVYSYHESPDAGIVNTQVCFKYNGKNVHVTLMQHKHTTRDRPQILLTTSS